LITVFSAIVDKYNMNKPYTYIIIYNRTGEFYIGSRSANRTQALDDLWCRYFTSSKLINERIKSEGTDCFTAQVIDEFETPEEAFVAEQLMISERISNPLCLNKTYQINGKQAFLTTGTKREHSTETRAKISSTLKAGAHRTYERTDEHLAVLAANGKQSGGWNKGKTYTINKVSARKGQPSNRRGQSMPSYECPHCARTIGGLGNFNKHLSKFHPNAL